MSANRRKRPDIIDCVQYVCNNYGRYGNITCTAHTIEARDLINAVIADINFYANMAKNDEKAVKILQQKLSAIDTSELKAYKKEKRKLTKRLAELDKLFTVLYEDRVMEKITERNYTAMSVKYEKEQFDIENRLKEIETELIAKGKNDKGIVDFISLIRNYQGITELTAAIVNTLIEKITVSEREKSENGDTVQRIKIYYKFVGSLHEFYIPTPKRNCQMNKKQCVRCGTAFIPKSNVSKRCPACAEEVNRINIAKSQERRKAKRAATKIKVLTA